ncbi:MAG TPA: hypothetical protein PLP23_18005, partial [Panacibacter sp.]|nr:hypothetical protein [Panacibacter sp.]
RRGNKATGNKAISISSFTAHCSLFTVHCSLFTVHCSIMFVSAIHAFASIFALLNKVMAAEVCDATKAS